MILHPLLLSLRVMAVATVLMVIAGLPLALRWRQEFPGRHGCRDSGSAAVGPPPTVVGYYLLLALGRGSPITDVSD